MDIEKLTLQEVSNLFDDFSRKDNYLYNNYKVSAEGFIDKISYNFIKKLADIFRFGKNADLYILAIQCQLKPVLEVCVKEQYDFIDKAVNDIENFRKENLLFDQLINKISLYIEQLNEIDLELLDSEIEDKGKYKEELINQAFGKIFKAIEKLKK